MTQQEHPAFKFHEELVGWENAGSSEKGWVSKRLLINEVLLVFVPSSSLFLSS